MLKKTLSTYALALLLGGVAFTQASCNRSNEDQQSTASADGQTSNNGEASTSDQAYEDFKSFVTRAESQADSLSTVADADISAEKARLQSEYDAKVAAATANQATWDEARRQEYEQLQSRYTAATSRLGSQDVAMNTGSTSGSDVSGSSSMDASSDASTKAKTGKLYRASNAAATLTAANARQTYESFVQRVKQNEDRYDIDDWRAINAEWRALDAKYDKIKGDVSGGDKAEIAKEKLKYAAIKSVDKSEARVSQGVDLVKGDKAEAEAKGEGVKIGQSAENAGKDVVRAGKDVGKGAVKVGEKVGHAVKEGYKDVRDKVKGDGNKNE